MHKPPVKVARGSACRGKLRLYGLIIVQKSPNASVRKGDCFDQFWSLLCRGFLYRLGSGGMPSVSKQNSATQPHRYSSLNHVSKAMSASTGTGHASAASLNMSLFVQPSFNAVSATRHMKHLLSRKNGPHHLRRRPLEGERYR